MSQRREENKERLLNQIKEVRKELLDLETAYATIAGEPPPHDEVARACAAAVKYSNIRPIEAVERYLDEHGPASRAAIVEAVIAGGNQANKADPEWNVNFSITTNVRSGYLQEDGNPGESSSIISYGDRTKKPKHGVKKPSA